MEGSAWQLTTAMKAMKAKVFIARVDLAIIIFGKEVSIILIHIKELFSIVNNLDIFYDDELSVVRPTETIFISRILVRLRSNNRKGFG